MHVAGTYALTGFETRSRGNITARRRAVSDQRWHFVGGERWDCLSGTPGRLAAVDLGSGRQTAADYLLDLRREPLFVVAHAQIFRRRNEFARMTGRVEIPLAPGPQRAREREHTPFPERVEDRLVLFALNGAHVLHAAHVVNAVHAWPPWSVTFATP